MSNSPKIAQIIDYLDYGDGVGNDVLSKNKLLISLSYDAQIFASGYSSQINISCNKLSKLCTFSPDIILHHFCRESACMPFVLKQPGKKILIYHNLTPEEMLDSENAYWVSKGKQQLEEHLIEYDFIVGDSMFNLESLHEVVKYSNKEEDILPIYIDYSRFGKKQIKKSPNEHPVFLSVGRIVANKCLEDVIGIFNRYYLDYDTRSCLYIVGNITIDTDYYNYLYESLNDLPCKDNVLFLGKVEDELLNALYHNADVFLSMSKHEGFCLPILEAMYNNNIVCAYSAGAIKENMGNSGIICVDKNHKDIAQVIYYALNNLKVYHEILNKQHANLERFNEQGIKNQLKCLIEKWLAEQNS